MFEDLFADGATIERYCTAPFLEERLRYLAHCAERGARAKTLRVIAVHQFHLVHLLDLQAGDRIGISRIEAAAEQWSLPGVHRFNGSAGPDARRRFVGHAVRWLRFADMFQEEPRRPRHPHTNEVTAFASWMRQEQGWSEETILGYCNAVDCFFDRLNDCGIILESVHIEDIDGQISHWHACELSRTTIKNYAQRLRIFFQFAERQGWCMPGLADGIMPPRHLPGGRVQRGLDRDEVVRLLATTEGDRPADLRARAILLLLITYGLRAGEVAGLRLDDLNWADERLQVRCPKPGRTHHYPLSRGVGRTILRYIREARPQHPERRLFLTLNAPIRPITAGTISHMVSSRVDRLEIVGKCRGPHALRHGAAQHLLDHGLSLKEVGDYLGHRSVSATATYAKVQLDTLREVGDINLEGMT